MADGITLSGIDQTWPRTDTELQGLLPDSFVLRDQKRNGPAINPATVQACAVHFYDQIPVYDFHAFRHNAILLHAPGRITRPSERAKHVSFQIEPWVEQPYFILLNGLTQQPRIEINGQQVGCSGPHQFLQSEGQLILKLEHNPSVELSL